MTQSFFEDYAELYDVVSRQIVDFEENTQFLLEVFAAHSGSGVRSILDLGCGTGEYVGRFRDRGLFAVGVDCSWRMLALARERSLGRGAFLLCDMATVSLCKLFDAVVCMYSSILYLASLDQVQDTLENAARHLSPGGVFVLDLPNQERELQRPPEEKTLMINATLYECKFAVSRVGQRLREKWIIESENDRIVADYSELLCDRERIRSPLESAGFEISAVFGDYATSEAGAVGDREILVCRKQGE